MTTYDVRFERVINKRTSLEGKIPLTAESREQAEEEFLDEIRPVSDGDGIEIIETEDADSPNGAPSVMYERIKYREVLVEGKAPVEADSPDEAERRFLEQVSERETRGGKYSGELDSEFEVIGVDSPQ